MGWIFLGALFTTINIYLQWENLQIDVLSDFIGYIFLYRGIQSVVKTESYLMGQEKRAKTIAIVLMMLGIAHCFLGAYALEQDRGWLIVVAGVVGIVLTYFLWYDMIAFFQEIEERKNIDLKSFDLYRLLKIMTVANVVSSILIYWGGVLALLAILASVIASILFLIDIYYVGKRYNRW